MPTRHGCLLHGADRQEHLCGGWKQLSKKYGLPHPSSRPKFLITKNCDCWQLEGITGLWLIGLWERSHASRIIKSVCAATAMLSLPLYSLKNYTIAQDLGGEAAYLHLKEPTQPLPDSRLASDMAIA